MAFQAIKDIAEDLKNSWYFRIWSLLWVVCAIVSFVALIILSRASNAAQDKPSFRMWTEMKSSINYPNLYVFLSYGEYEAENIKNINCVFGPNNVTVDVTGCDGGNQYTGECQMIVANTTTSVYPPSTNPSYYQEPEGIWCEIYTDYNTTAGKGPYNTMIGIVADDTAAFPTYMNPGAVSWMTMEQEVVTDKQFNGGKPVSFFRLQSTIISNQAPDGARMAFFVGFATFSVTHFETIDFFNGWMGVGAIGGFGFFLYILHAAIMGIIGLFITNNSVFLLGGAKRSTYDNL